MLRGGALRHERARRRGTHPDLRGVALRGGTREHHVLADLEDGARDDHGSREVLNRRDGAGLLACAIHHRRTRLHGAIARQRGAHPRAELRIVLEHAHRRDDRIERGAAAIEERLPCRRRRANTRSQPIVSLRRDQPSTAMDEDHGERRITASPIREGRRDFDRPEIGAQ